MPSPHILVVEDDAHLRKTLHDILALKGYAPVSAATGQAALAAAESQAPAAAIIDLKLADISGLEVLRQLKARSPAIECIMVTGYASQASAIETVNLGAYSYVQKPYDMEQLLTILRRALERREGAEALRASEARYRMLIENVGEGIGFVNADERFLFANPAAERLFGAPPGGLRGQSLQAFSSPEQFAVITAQTRQRGENSVYELDIGRADGEKRRLLVTAVPQFSEAGVFSGSFDVFHDITERRQMEVALREERALLAQRVEERTAELSLANAALNRAARLKDEFLANMSHELRTPLTGILGLSETLQMGVYGALTDKQNDVLRVVHESGEHLLNLINDILDLSKVEAGKMELKIERTQVAQVCLGSVQFVKETALRKNLRLATSLDAQVATIRADPRRLKQMLVNLLGNAVKFTPEGGEIGLSVEGDPVRQVARFTVWDTGIGIAPADVERLFQPFVQLDSGLAREYAGTGLGLSLVLRMAGLHGGGVTVESEGVPGKGSRFTVTLPWQPTDEPADSARPGLVPEEPLKLRRVVTVEDAAIAAEQLTRYLSELGIENTVHPTGTGALDKVLEVRPDVILLDILLPDISGWEVLRQLKADARTRGIPVIVVSVVDDRPQGQALGAAAYLVKPVALSDLHTALEACARHDSHAGLRSALVVAGSDRPLILLVDDSDTVIMTLTGLLAAHAFRLATARSGEEVLTCAQHQHPNLILMDIQMPGVDGLQAIRRIRADPDRQLAAIPIIALTTLVMPGDRERCLEAGANEYLSKPVSVAVLIKTIETQLTRALPKAGYIE